MLILRPEHDEWDFVVSRRALIDAVLVIETYAAPYPDGHSMAGKQHERLVHAIHAARCPLWRDPDTAGLCSRSVARLPITSRRLQTPVARNFPLPLDPRRLVTGRRWRLLTDISLEAQAGCEAAVAPYLDFDALADPRLQLNLQMARRTATSVAEQVPMAVLQVTRHALLSGLLWKAASHYAAAGVRRVLLRVRGLNAPRATRAELSAYLDAVEAFRRRDIAAIPDCVGILGPVLVAGKAAGFTTGTRFFNRVPAALLSVGGGGGGKPIEHQPMGSWKSSVRPATMEAADARMANFQNLRTLMELGANDPDALIESLRREGTSYSRAWAAELAVRRRRTA
jgi:hypothetical protein